MPRSLTAVEKYLPIVHNKSKKNKISLLFISWGFLLRFPNQISGCRMVSNLFAFPSSGPFQPLHCALEELYGLSSMYRASGLSGEAIWWSESLHIYVYLWYNVHILKLVDFWAKSDYCWSGSLIKIDLLANHAVSDKKKYVLRLTYMYRFFSSCY